MNDILLVSSIIFIFGCSLICFSIYWILGVRRSSKWEEIEGQVTESCLVEHSSGNSSVGRSVTYKALIQYTYTVNGKLYNSERVYWGDTLLSSRKAESKQLISRFCKGEKVIVFYCPNDPKQSILILGYYNENIVVSLVLGILFAITGVVFYFIL